MTERSDRAMEQTDRDRMRNQDQDDADLDTSRKSTDKDVPQTEPPNTVTGDEHLRGQTTPSRLRTEEDQRSER